MRTSSGTTKVDTSSDTAVTLISAETIRATAGVATGVRITNESAIKGFYSLDGGASWCRIANATVVVMENQPPIVSVLAKRIPSGTDVTDLYADVWG